MQLDDAALALNVPAGHTEQASELELAYEPGAHTPQEVEPAAAKVLAGQGVHCAADEMPCAPKVPAGQGVHAVVE